MRSHNYINIQGWMVTHYKLKPAECMIYAIIYGFSQKDGQVFDLSLRYLQDSTLLSRSSVIEKLNFLLDKGYIIKDDKSKIGEQQRYIAIPVQNLDGCNNTPSEKQTGTRPESESVPVQNLAPPRPEFGHYNNLLNNKSNNKSNNKDKIKEYTHEPEIFDSMSSEKFIEILETEEKRKKVAAKKEKFGEHENVLLTEAECNKLRLKYSMEDINWIIEKLSNFKLSKGKVYKSDYGAINTWVIQALEDHKKKNNGSTSGSGQNNGNAFTRIAEQIRNNIQFNGS